MTLQELQVSFQVLTSLVLTAGLIFSGVQFYHYRKSLHVANFTKLVELQMQLRRMRVDNPSLAHVSPDDVAGLESDRDIQYYFLNLMQLSIFEIVWFSHLNGQLPDDYFESWVHRMKKVKGEESFHKAMKKGSVKFFHDEFEKYLVDLTRSGGG